MKYKNLNVSIIYFIIHFILEVTCFYILSFYMKTNIFWYIALFYDLIAFGFQPLIGSISDKKRNIDFGFIGIILSIISLLCLFFKLPTFIVLLFLTFGNAMLHISGAESTLRTSDGKIFPASLFVSGGAIGIITGRLLYKYKVSVLYIVLINIISIILILIAKKYKKFEKENLLDFNFDNKKINTVILITLVVFVVSVRSYMSYGIPTTWNNTVLDSVLLYLFMMIGKALGGYLVDNIGIKKTSFISTVIALPFLLFGDNNTIISLIGIMLFSMTMSITLAIIVSRLKERPGIAFGFTTIGLLIGTLPVFITRYSNNIIFAILTFLCIIILYKISYERKL